MSCLAISYSRNGSASLTANASDSPDDFGRALHTRACINTPAPLTGKREGGSTEERIFSGTHFFPQRRQGTSFMFLNGANL
mmetsp:Transcript_1203/g.1609  ORF Transcript_1203/g.1609 Transcript_1203/m.1609 type:complete len:81 (-) Transcript_1203:908-1150(-)